MTSRLFHFDLKPRNNYGDSVLFELVRHVFTGYAGRGRFLVTSTANLRHEVGEGRLARANRHDAVLLGGGGLMLRSTNANPNSGWQWNISLDRLQRLTAPLVVFGVGYNRFEGEPDFDPVFTDHLNETVARSVFFGLRNHGSLRAVRAYLRPDLAERVGYQPCPTTVAAHLVPDLYVPDLGGERRVGLQVTWDPRNALAGHDRGRIFGELGVVARELHRLGYALDVISHSAADVPFAQHLSGLGVPARDVRLHEPARGVFGGLAYYARVPLTIGMRGHGQMVPFGMGNGIISVATRRKLRYFLDDIGRPELAVDPRADGWARRVLDLVEAYFADVAAERARFAAVREQLWAQTLANVAAIDRAVTGGQASGEFVPLSPFERELALNTYAAAMDADREAEQAARVRAELGKARREATRAGAELARVRQRLAAREAELAKGGLHLAYRGARRRIGRLLGRRAAGRSGPSLR